MESVNLQNAETALETCSQVAVLTSGISMRPLFREHRDVAVIERVTRELKVGDVLLYKRGENIPFVLHRILKITPEGFITRGDNTFYLENVKHGDVIGVLHSFYREGKYHDCATDKGYRVYVFLNRISYPLRYALSKVRPFLGRIKRKLLK